jgi:hypothetical protein
LRHLDWRKKNALAKKSCGHGQYSVGAPLGAPDSIQLTGISIIIIINMIILKL